MKHTIIKLGGSVLTDKSQEQTIRQEAIKELMTVINNYKREEGEKIWLFHGGGSMAHFAAQRWQKSGDMTEFKAAAKGMTQLNSCIQKLLKKEFSYHPAREFWDLPHSTWLQHQLTPSIFLGHGDAVTVRGKQMIVSTEDQISSLVTCLGDTPKRVLFLTDTAGVLDNKGKTISSLRADKIPKLKPTKGADVTGSMAGKLNAAFALLSPTTRITIASGLDAQNLSDWLESTDVAGTVLQS